MFVTIKDVSGKLHVSPVGFVNASHKNGEYCAKILYNTQEPKNILIDKDEYRRILVIQRQEEELCEV